MVTSRGRGRQCAPAAHDRALLGGPSTSPLAVAMKVLLGVVALVALMASALWWYLEAARPAPSGIVAIVDVPGDYSTCSVGLNGSLHDVPCRDVGGYLRDTLKLRLDAGVLIRPRGNADGHAMTEQVYAAGYLIVPYMGGIEMAHGDR